MKKIKDPLYGYINIDSSFINIIDSPYFQRLRNIIQTSYTSIYPSSLHNRFTHSLGVYYLGSLAFNCLLKNGVNELKDEKITKEMIEKIRKTFLFACLCHDLGHSPFSHTSEVFYNGIQLAKELDELVNNPIYSNDLKKAGGNKGKNHEIMSALLSLRVFPNFIEKENYDFFARSITGLKYTVQNSKVDLLKQACIELLNSEIIDVDKLDYIIRDSYMAGYDSAVIDYERLLSGVTVYNIDNPICYKKSSLSVLESVLNAHDLEKRWVQTHPVVLYESYLLQQIIKAVDNKYSKDKLFSYESLTIDGIILDGIGNLRLLSDTDILFLAKMMYDTNDDVKEYLDRGKRRHSLWKSEAEFSVLFDNGNYSQLLKTFEHFSKTLVEQKNGSFIINKALYDNLISKREALLNISKNEIIKEKSQMDTILSRVEQLEKEIKLIETFKKIFDEKNIEMEIVFIPANRFVRNISKEAFEKLPIMFDNLNNKVVPMKSLSPMIQNDLNDKKYFYFYCKKEYKNMIDLKKFCKELEKLNIDIRE